MGDRDGVIVGVLYYTIGSGGSSHKIEIAVSGSGGFYYPHLFPSSQWEWEALEHPPHHPPPATYLPTATTTTPTTPLFDPPPPIISTTTY